MMARAGLSFFFKGARTGLGPLGARWGAPRGRLGLRRLGLLLIKKVAPPDSEFFQKKRASWWARQSAWQWRWHGPGGGRDWELQTARAWSWLPVSFLSPDLVCSTDDQILNRQGVGSMPETSNAVQKEATAIR
jgi:hypothetical protein